MNKSLVKMNVGFKRGGEKVQQPKLTLIGIGVGHIDYLTTKAKHAIQEADVVLGAKRLIETVAPLTDKGEMSGISEIEEKILAHPNARCISIIVSGDVGFYSLANTLREKFKNRYELTQISGISSMQYFMNTLGKRYENVCTVSMHGRNEQLLYQLKKHHQVFVLTGGVYSVNTLCELLETSGYQQATIFVGERLSYADEKISQGMPRDLKTQVFESLSVMLIEHNMPLDEARPCIGIADEAFERTKVPMTKSEIRVLSLSKLALKSTDVVYDIGAGTGSVSIEMALQVPKGKVYALERKEEAISLIETNAKKFGVSNLEIIATNCPDGMETLEKPDAVFIGGSGGELENILKIVLSKNNQVKVVINAITLETLTEALRCFKKFGFIHQDISQISVANSKTVGAYHMMMGQNPIFILSGQGVGAIE